MTSTRRSGLILRLLTLVLGPMLVGALVLAGGAFRDRRDTEPGDAGPAFLAAAAAVAEDALDSSISAAAANAGRPPLDGLLVGIGIYFNDGDYYEWEGTPLSVPPPARSPETTTGTEIRSGLTTRLMVVTGQDGTGRRASATFDLPPVSETGRFGGTVTPDRRARAAAALTFTLLLAIVLIRPAVRRGRSWTAAAFLAILAGRVALAAAHVPAGLLPPDLGTASRYGSGKLLGLIGSPADLLLTCVAVWLLFALARTLLPRGRMAGILSSAVLVAVSALWVRLVAASIASNSDLRLLDSRSILMEPPGALLLASLSLAVLAASVAVLALMDRVASGQTALKRTAAILAVSIIAANVFFQGREQVDLERLQFEYAPQVLEQQSRRLVALRAGLRRAAADPESLLAVGELQGRPEPGPASRIWTRGDLLEAGYRSSITIRGADGQAVSHFGFGLPQLEEDPAEIEPGRIVTETFEPLGSLGSVRMNLIHSQEELPDGAGWVVAHVVEEPDNLPFLPANHSYLAALAPARVPGRGASASPDPEYVLYDSAGIVQFSTLVQPPAWRVEFDRAAFDGETVVVKTPEGNYHAQPLLDRDRLHLHLLLSPASTGLERAGGMIRLALATVLLLALVRGLPLLLSRSGPSRVVGILRRSFHRKLMTTLLVVSVVPLIVLSLFLMQAIEDRMDASILDTAGRYGEMARRVVEDYGTTQSGPGEGVPLFDDNLLYWLRRVVGQEIHLFEDGLLTASSQRELFQAGLMVPRLPGSIYREMLQENKPARVVRSRLGRSTVPVAYAPVRLDDPSRKVVVAVPLLYPRSEIRREVNRVVELLLLTTVALVGLLAVAAAVTARTVARPVREMVHATNRIAHGRYDTRLHPSTRDELADLVNGFNSMARSLEAQRTNLTRRKDYIEALLLNATAGVVSTDPDGRVVTINPAARRLLGLDERSLAEGDPLIEGVARAPRLAPLLEALRRPAPSTDPMEIDLPDPDQGQDKQRLSLVQVPLQGMGETVPGTLIIMDDVTDMMRSSQLEAWAEMARAIAHEIKNPLTPIQLSTEHLERILKDRGDLPSRELEACLDTIKKQVRGLREIAAGFSAYAKLPALKPETVDPVEFMREAAAPYRAGAPEGLTIVEEYQPCPAIAMDSKVLGRAVVNLIENGLQAMSGPTGTLTLQAVPEPDERAVRLTVADTGSGLTPEARRRLFEPYFSTKSSGTGLGLAIVKQSVEAHGGRVQVESVPGGGTRFHILLPLDSAGV